MAEPEPQTAEAEALAAEAVLNRAGQTLALALVEGLSLVVTRMQSGCDLAVQIDRDALGRPALLRLVCAPPVPIPPSGPSPSPDTVSILAAIQGLQNIMSLKLSASVAALIASDATLKGEVDQIIADDVANRQNVAAAVAKALADEDVSEDAQAAILDTVNTSLQAHTALIVGLLNPNPVTSVQISPSDLTGTVGVALNGSFTSNLTGNVGFTVDSPPDGLVVNADGSYSWTPTEAESGSFNVTASAGTGETGTDEVTFEIAAAS